MMNVGIYLAFEDQLILEAITNKLNPKHDLKGRGNCLCEEHALDSLDAVIVHPHDTNDFGCWDRIRDLMDKYQDVRFLVFSIDSIIRKDFFGIRPNVTYLDENTFRRYERDPEPFLQR